MCVCRLHDIHVSSSLIHSKWKLTRTAHVQQGRGIGQEPPKPFPSCQFHTERHGSKRMNEWASCWRFWLRLLGLSLGQPLATTTHLGTTTTSETGRWTSRPLDADRQQLDIGSWGFDWSTSRSHSRALFHRDINQQQRMNQSREQTSIVLNWTVRYSQDVLLCSSRWHWWRWCGWCWWRRKWLLTSHQSHQSLDSFERSRHQIHSWFQSSVASSSTSMFDVSRDSRHNRVIVSMRCCLCLRCWCSFLGLVALLVVGRWWSKSKSLLDLLFDSFDASFAIPIVHALGVRCSFRRENALVLELLDDRSTFRLWVGALVDERTSPELTIDLDLDRPLSHFSCWWWWRRGSKPLIDLERRWNVDAWVLGLVRHSIHSLEPTRFWLLGHRERLDGCHRFDDFRERLIDGDVCNAILLQRLVQSRNESIWTSCERKLRLKNRFASRISDTSMHESTECLIQQVASLDWDREQATCQVSLFLSLATVDGVGGSWINHRDRLESTIIEHFEAMTKLWEQVFVKLVLLILDCIVDSLPLLVSWRFKLQSMTITKWAQVRLVDCLLEQTTRSKQSSSLELEIRGFNKHRDRSNRVIEISNNTRELRGLDQQSRCEPWMVLASIVTQLNERFDRLSRCELLHHSTLLQSISNLSRR